MTYEQQRANEIKAERHAERVNVKRALIAAGFTGVSVKHGRGTTHSWLEVAVDGKFTGAAHQALQELVIKVSGRNSLAAEHVSVNFMGAYDAPAVEVL